jgi:hypothetical protein
MGLKVPALSPSGDGNPAFSVAIARDEGGSMISSSKDGLQGLKSLRHRPVAGPYLCHGMVRTGTPTPGVTC